ncbi:hypothetical protein [Halobellus salinisoli]|uniref:hypothetical protein n=1 Tax=Halobellus salinisoli TaxID=3108500 RepID=UPI0030080B9F
MNGTDAVEGDGGNELDSEEPTAVATNVSAHQSSPERVVFTESGNCDGWISIDADLASRVRR